VTIERVVVLSYILAFAMPPLGFALGVGLGVKVRSKHWRWIVLVSVIGGVIWAIIIGSGALSTTTEGY
jgi:NhaP-type Na+/H+ or K+/H+ antiporter